MNPTNTIHITSGDCAGDLLAQTGLTGEVFVWHDILYEGPRNAGWPTEDTLQARATHLEQATGGGLKRERILETLRAQYRRLAAIDKHTQINLWFDACLFDQSMLSHILTCLQHLGISQVHLLCIDTFPGIEPYNGLGQLKAEQLASCYNKRQTVTEAQFNFAIRVDQAFATQNIDELSELADTPQAPLPWVPAAVARWIQEQSYAGTELGRIEYLALAAIRAGCDTPGKIFASVASADTPPQFWGDTTLWAKINGLADRTPSAIKIKGPSARLPQWESPFPLEAFKITAI